MAHEWDRQRMRKQPWPILGLLLVAAFLGHDVLMAAEASAATTTGAAHHAPGSPAHGDEVSSPQDGGTSEHPENCRIGQAAVQRSGDEHGHADSGVVSVPGIVGILAAVTHETFVAWVQPSWPPGTRRALLQVYRI
jgi:hypothetical protein